MYSYDPENRLTKVEYDSDVTDQAAALPMAEYRYDALGRRIEAIKYDASGTNATTTRYCHDGQNIVAEYIKDSNQQESLARGFVNGSQYIDERVAMRDYVTVAGNAHPRDFYYLHQELYSEAGLAAANGSLAEAYVYDTYGQARIYQWPTGDFDRDGDVDTTDQTTLTSNYASPVTTPWYDLDADGDADAADLAVMVETSAPTELAYSGVGNPYLFTGRLTDTLHANNPTDTTHIRRLQDNRWRIYDPKHGRWMQHDPADYLDGMNTYQYASTNPVSARDPSGLATCKDMIEDLMQKVEAPPGGQTRCQRIMYLYTVIAYGGGLKCPQAGQMMMHWLRGSGEPKHVEEGFFKSDTNVRKVMHSFESSTRKWVSDQGCKSASGWTPGQSIIVTGAECLYYAMGTFSINAKAYFKKDPSCHECSRKLGFQWFVYDTYDWHKNLVTNVCGAKVPDKYALELEQCPGSTFGSGLAPRPFDLSFMFTDDMREGIHSCVGCR